MKILVHSNAPWAATGYGQQCGLFAPRLAEHHDVAISAFYGLEGSQLQFNEKVKVLPGRGGTFGNESIRGHARSHFGGLRDGLVLTLMDVWVLDPNIWKTMNVACWVPVDHEPVPPGVRRFFQNSGAIPIAMSRFGQEQLSAHDALYVPHGIDCNSYVPFDPVDAKKLIGFPETAFLVGIVAANKGWGRKCFPEMLEAFSIFRKRHDDALLYLHTEVSGFDDGVNLNNVTKALDIPDEAIRLCDQHTYQFDPLPPHMMASLYSSFDVLLSTSRGEGFGLCVLEANACGTPAIVTDFSAQPEVCGAGWTVDGRLEWQQQQSWQKRPDVEDIVDALEQAYQQPEATRVETAKKARTHAEGYHVDKVMSEHMLPAIDEVMERLDARKPVELAS